MKKAIFWLLMALGLPAGAESITEAEAKQQAWAFLQRQAQRRAKSAGDQPRQPVLTAVALPHSGASTAGTATTQGVRPLYVFNIDEGDGFVVIAGDDRLKPVLAYVDNGRFDAADLPPGTAWWLETARKQVELATREGILPEPVAPKAEGETPTEVAPLIETTWGQDYPYNELCPMDPTANRPSSTGCVATALAQIFYYYRQPAAAKGTVSYTTENLGIEINEDLGTYTFDYDLMLPDYGYGTSPTAEEKEAVAKLMYACGVAAQMDYSATFSGAYSYPQWVLDHFDVDPSLGYEERCWHTTTEWDAMVRTELEASRPVFYCGYSAEGGHAFICDGYNSEGLYHINWGWNGYYNGYFELATLGYQQEGQATPPVSVSNFGLGQLILTRLMPNEGGTQPPTRLTLDGGLTFDESEQTLDEVKLYLNWVKASYADFNGYAGFGFYDSEGTLKEKVVEDIGKLSRFNYYEQMWVSGALDAAHLTPGSYTVKAICSTDGTNFQPFITPVGNGKNNWLRAEVDAEKVTFTAPAEVAYALSIPAEGVVVPEYAVGGENTTVEFEVKNSGPGRYTGDCYILKNDGSYASLGAFALDIPGGGSQTVTYQFYAPTERATLPLALGYYDYEGTYTLLDLATVTVKCHDLRGSRLTVLTPVIAPGESVRLRIDMPNTGDLAFNGELYTMIENDAPYYDYYTDAKDVEVGIGETKHVVVTHDLMYESNPEYTAPEGKYIVYTYEMPAYTLLSVNTFEVGTQGSLSVNTAEGYGTACLTHAFRVPAGMRCGVVTETPEADNVLTIDYRYAEGDVVPAGTAVILQAPQGTYTYDIVADDDTEAPTDNLLCGTIDSEGRCYAGEGNFKYYMLSYNAQGEHLGFYYGLADGAAFLNGPTQAYLALPLADANFASYRLFDGEGTGLGQAAATDRSDVPTYSTDGRRSLMPLKNLPAGVYIRGGKKVVK